MWVSLEQAEAVTETSNTSFYFKAKSNVGHTHTPWALTHTEAFQSLGTKHLAFESFVDPMGGSVISYFP